ncbi:MAG: phage tail assembly protein [Oxalobacter sp.]|nr:phage tail assembly protein [Oxalobacter sp.]
MENLDNHEHNHDNAAPSPAADGAGVKKNTVLLDEPIQRGNTTITEITVRKPKSGELRGVTLTALSEMDVIALQKVLPRVTTPVLNSEEIAKMEPADLMKLGVQVAVFLLPKADREMVSLGE